MAAMYSPVKTGKERNSFSCCYTSEVKAVWRDVVIAESDDTIVVEGNHYFPAASIKMEYLTKSKNIYHCPWKGYADYYNMTVAGEENADAAWVYPAPYPPAANIKGRFAFWHGIDILN